MMKPANFDTHVEMVYAATLRSSLTDAEQRVMFMLWTIAEAKCRAYFSKHQRMPKGDITVQTSHDRLGSLIGYSRITVQRILLSLRERGMLTATKTWQSGVLHVTPPSAFPLDLIQSNSKLPKDSLRSLKVLLDAKCSRLPRALHTGNAELLKEQRAQKKKACELKRLVEDASLVFARTADKLMALYPEARMITRSECVDMLAEHAKQAESVRDPSLLTKHMLATVIATALYLDSVGADKRYALNFNKFVANGKLRAFNTEAVTRASKLLETMSFEPALESVKLAKIVTKRPTTRAQPKYNGVEL